MSIDARITGSALLLFVLISGASAARSASDDTTKLLPADRLQLGALLQKQMQACLQLDGVSAIPVPVVKIELSRNGEIVSDPVLVNTSDEKDFRRTAETGLRGLRQCAPFKIAAQYQYGYGSWKNVRIGLDPNGFSTNLNPPIDYFR